MLDNIAHRKIQKKLRDINLSHIENEKSNGTYNEHFDSDVPDNTLSQHLKGFEKKYQKQVPVIGSGKKLNMEIEPKRNNSLRNLPMMFYTAVENNIKGGNIPNFQDENTDAERYKDMELMGAGGENEEEEIRIERNLGGSKSKSNKKTITNINTNVKKVVEVVEGSDVAKEHKEEQPKKKAGRPKKTVETEAPPVVKKSRGRPKKQTIVEAPEIVETEIIGSGNGSSMIQRRGNLIKKVMKEQGLSLIQASKHIKEKGLKY